VSLKSKLQVMVVDDMAVSRGLIIQSLEAAGIENIDYSTDGQSAFQKLAARPVHLVISDYNMPGADGLQLLAGLRQHKTTEKIGFILVTGTANPDVIEQGKRLGMNNFIQKPFSEAALKTCVEQVVGRL